MIRLDWYNEPKNVKIKEDKVVVKLYRGNTFIDSCIVPTVYYPLNGKFEVFTAENTKQVTDKKILEIFDKIDVKIGHCYQNTDNLVKELRKAGYNAKSYVGWLFTGGGQYPIHHCWCMLEDHLLDLTDYYTQMFSEKNIENFKDAKTKEEQALVMADFLKAAQKAKNSAVCYPVGVPTSFMFYIGCECDPDVGRVIYQRLMREFPDHKCDRTDKNGLNQTQRIFKREGLM